MNRFYAVLLVLVSANAVVLGATTNVTGNGTQTVVFNGLSFTGGTAQVAATISTVAELQSTDTVYVGGTGASSGLASPGSAGLSLQGVALTTISNQPTSAFEIKGGAGGIAAGASGGSQPTALGGAGISVNPASFPDFIPGTDQLNIGDGLITGGAGGTVTGVAGNLLNASGGAAVKVNNAIVNWTGGTLVGGAGGKVTANTANATAAGGDGLLTDFDTTVSDLGANVSAIGGKGGTITSITGGTSADATGGDGINHQGFNFNPAFFMNITGGSYQGGAGGTVIGQSGINAVGGDGMYMQVQQAIITGGTFTGGAGGTVTVTNSTATAKVNGGRGLFVGGNPLLDIQGGTFIGGAAGTRNGVAGSQGNALYVIDSFTTISGGTFDGTALFEGVGSAPSVTEISGGSFDDVRFTTALPSVTMAASISGGTFGDLLFDGAGSNNVTITGGALGDITLKSSSVGSDLTVGGTSSFEMLNLTAGLSTIAISNGVTSSGTVTQTGGEATINLWSDSHFADTSVSNANMSFNGRAFDLQDQSTFTLTSLNAQVDFNDGLNVLSGGALNVGLGQVTASDITVNGSGALNVGLGQVTASNFVSESGAELVTLYDGAANGLIRGEILDFKAGTTWTIEGGTNAVTVGQGFLLAESTASNLTQALVLDDVAYTGSGAKWLEGITNVIADGVYLRAFYGDRELDETFEEAGIGPDSDLGKVVADLNKVLTKGSAQWETIKGLGATAEQVALVLGESFTRTPEMASSLVGLHSVFADQIADRTRSRLRLSNWSGATASLPQGAAGPSDWYGNTVDWLRDHTPSWNGRNALRDASENAPDLKLRSDEPDVGKAYTSGYAGKGGSYETMKDKMDELVPRGSGKIIEIPTNYQIWGRGYGARLDQKSSATHSGYEASVAGGIVGMDKRVDNLLIGVGGGYARTDLRGGTGNDGIVQTGHAVGYMSAIHDQFYFDANLNYAFSGVETESNPSLGYTGDYDAHTLGFYLGGGMGMSFWNDTLLFTPNASLLSTLYDREGYTETSSMGMPDKNYGAYDQWSYLGSLGASLSMLGKIESFDLEMEFQPEVRVHWLHEFNADPDGESYTLVGGANSIDVGLQAREEDLVKIGTGVQFSKWGSDTTEFGLDLDYTFGQDYSAYMVSGRIMHRF